MSDLTRVEAAAAALDSLPEEPDTADYIGRLDKVIRTLQGHRRLIMDELSGPVSGTDYRIVERRECARSYNDTALLRSFDREEIGIPELVEADVLRLSWQWSKLRSLANLADIGLRIAGHEVTDGDEADHVGEVWKTKLTVEPVTPID